MNLDRQEKGQFPKALCNISQSLIVKGMDTRRLQNLEISNGQIR